MSNLKPLKRLGYFAIFSIIGTFVFNVNPIAFSKAPAKNTNSSAQRKPTTKPIKSFDYGKQVGFVESKQNNPPFLRIKNPHLPTGTPVHLIVDDEPQTHFTASIQKKLKQSSTDPNTEPDDTTYLLKLSKPVPDAHVSIGIVGFHSILQVKNRFLRADLNQDGQADAFRSCTSHEGLHLTVWNGTPLKSSKKWHRYYYLGYDTEPSCTEKDYE